MGLLVLINLILTLFIHINNVHAHTVLWYYGNLFCNILGIPATATATPPPPVNPQLPEENM